MLPVKDAWSTLHPTVCDRDLYSVLNPITWICRIGGIFPLKLEGPVGKRNYSTSYGLIIYSLIVLVVSVTGLCVLTEHTNRIHMKISQYEVARISINFEMALEICSMVLMVATAILSKDKFANAIDNIKSQDISLQKLGTELDYAADLKQQYIQLAITMSIVVILCTYDFAYQLTLNLNHPFRWIAWLCPNFVRIASAYLLMNVLIVLKQRFAALNEHLIKMIEETKDSSSPVAYERICERICSIAMIHGSLCETAESVNQTFGWNIVAGVIYSLIILTTATYYAIEELTDANGHSYIRIFGFINWVLICSSHIITTVISCHYTQNQACLTGKLIHRFPISGADTPLNNVIRSFSLQLHHEKIEFSAAGFFPLDATLIQMIVGAVTTYLVILIQFHGSNEPLT